MYTANRLLLFVCHRRRAEFGMLDDPCGNLSDADLLLFVNTQRQIMPTVGEGLLTGSLRSHGYHISRARVRTALRSSDPLGQALRWPGVLTYH